MRILGVTREEIVSELRPFVVDGVSHSGLYQRRQSVNDLAVFLSGDDDGVTVTVARERINDLFGGVA